MVAAAQQEVYVFGAVLADDFSSPSPSKSSKIESDSSLGDEFQSMWMIARSPILNGRVVGSDLMCAFLSAL